MTTETCNLGFEDLDCQSLSSKNAGPRCLNSLVLVSCFAAWPGGSFGTQLCPSRRIAEHGVSCFLIFVGHFRTSPALIGEEVNQTGWARVITCYFSHRIFRQRPISPSSAGTAQLGCMRPSSKLRVVIVEDSHVFARRMREALEEIPHLEIVGAAETPSQAIRTIGAQQPDLVLLDINLTRGSGIDVLRAIKNRGFPGVVFMMTSEPSEPVRTACLQLKAAELFDKAEPEELLAAVAELASKPAL